MAQKSVSVSRKRQDDSSTLEGGMHVTRHFRSITPAQPVFPERKSQPPSSAEDQAGMMRGRGSFAEDSSQRRKKEGGGEGRGALMKADNSSHHISQPHPSSSSHHTLNERHVNASNRSSKDTNNKVGSNYNGQNRGNSAMEVKLEPGENSRPTVWHPETYSSPFWTALPSDALIPLKDDKHDLDYSKMGTRGHSGNPLGHGADPLEYFRNPSWHEKNFTEQDGESLGHRGNPIQFAGYSSEQGSAHSSDRTLLLRHERGKSSVCEGNGSKETYTQPAQSERGQGQMMWPSEKAASAMNNEEEEEELFHPPVHFHPHPQGLGSSVNQQPHSPQWEAGEIDDSDLPICEDEDFSAFPISTFRARLDETKCHKRRNITPENTEPAVIPEQLNECPHCDASFVDANNLRRHISYIHPDKVGENDRGRKRKRRCEECGKMFDRPSRLERHKVVHSDEKPFVCEICNKAFSRASNLKIHQNLHTGRKPFVCEVCNKAFSDSGKLKKHTVVHTGDKPFVCDICHKGFAETGNLKRHKKYHIGHKAFACDVCGKAFIESGMLRRHKVQTNHNPIICFVCNRTFLLPENLEEHSKVHTQPGHLLGSDVTGTKP